MIKYCPLAKFETSHCFTIYLVMICAKLLIFMQIAYVTLFQAENIFVKKSEIHGFLKPRSILHIFFAKKLIKPIFVLQTHISTMNTGCKPRRTKLAFILKII